jgi:hypothetical protein
MEQHPVSGTKSTSFSCRPSWGDYLLTLALLGLSVWSFFPLSRAVAGNARLAQVYHEGRLIRQLDLTDNRRVDVADGKMTLEVSGGRIRVLKSDCAGGVCMRTGWISHPPQTIVCAPHRMAVAISGGRAPPADEASKCDAIAY